MLCSIKTMSNSMFVHHTTQLTGMNQVGCSLGFVTLLEATDFFGVHAVLNTDDAQLDVCSSFETALSTPHLNVKLNNLLESTVFP